MPEYMMRIQSGDEVYFYVCPNRKHKKDTGTIGEYYSERHAYDKGWRKTKDSNWCPPEEDFVWVCPNCAKGETNA